MYGGEPAPNSAPALPPARPAGIAQERDSWPAGCRPKMLRKPKNMVNAPSVSSTGLVGSVSSAKAPMQAPIMPDGSSTLISPQSAFLRLVLPSTSEAVKSSASTSGTAKVQRLRQREQRHGDQRGAKARDAANEIRAHQNAQHQHHVSHLRFLPSSRFRTPR